MNGIELIDALKRRGEWGSYFTYEGYEFLKQLKNAREIWITLRVMGVADARETDSAMVLLDKLHHALENDSPRLISQTGLPGFHL